MLLGFQEVQEQWNILLLWAEKVLGVSLTSSIFQDPVTKYSFNYRSCACDSMPWGSSAHEAPFRVVSAHVSGVEGQENRILVLVIWGFCLSLLFNGPVHWHELFSCSVVSDSLEPHGLQEVRLPCPSPSPRVWSDSCPVLPSNHLIRIAVVSICLTLWGWAQSSGCNGAFSSCLLRGCPFELQPVLWSLLRL